VHLEIDLGGTKIEAAVRDATGRKVESHREPTHTKDGPGGLITQLIRISGQMKARHPFTRIEIGACGPLDPKAGVLLDPTNLFTNGKSWGRVEVVRPLEAALKVPVKMENDAAMAALNEMRYGGHGPRARNLVVVTLGTGVGVGVICNGELVRSGRGLHPEFSHVFLNPGSADAPCGCGNSGCMEAYLSGPGFSG
jgi:glucokinase